VRLGRSQLKKNTVHANFCRPVLCSIVYNTWRNRNETRHGSQPKTDGQILKKMFWEVRTRILGKLIYVYIRHVATVEVTVATWADSHVS
jgi:hypothetical protein